MPLPISSRRYDQHFWDELLGAAIGERGESDILTELGF
jgi:hypothetical protein